jgi:hypothetical protein
MKTYVIVETAFHAGLIERLLRAECLPDFAVVRGGRGTSAVRLASSLHSDPGVPVIVVLNADTVEPLAIEESRASYAYLLRTVSHTPGIRSALLMAVPQVEVVLFSDPEALECVLGRALTEREKIEGEFRPRAVLDRLLEEIGMDGDAFLARINARAATRFAAHPLIQSLVRFIEDASAATAVADAA